ncbi:ENTH domain-containing protein [Chytriomyces sp. MP71]|nr:ENTH domain-containing protein [Chytriomyces sp. MP71]
MNTIRRAVKEYANAYTDTELKVRNATANTPAVPNKSELAVIAARTNDMKDFLEIMRIVDKRLNDSAKYWRHKEKALALLDYLLLAGSKKVFIVAKANIRDIEKLTRFSGEGEGALRIRELSKNIVAFLNDEVQLESLRKLRERNLNHLEPADTLSGSIPAPVSTTASAPLVNISPAAAPATRDAAIFASAFEGLPPSLNPDKDAANPFSDFAAALYTNPVAPLDRLPRYASLSTPPTTPKNHMNVAEVDNEAAGSSGHRDLPPPPLTAFYTAIYDYAGTGESDLKFMTGDRIQVIVKKEDGWWRGKAADGREGVFPSNYVVLSASLI